MTSLLLTAALTGSPAVAAHPPGFPAVPPPGYGVGHPGFPGYPGPFPPPVPFPRPVPPSFYPPAVRPVPVFPGVPVLPVAPPTLAQFAAAFQPTPGHHKVCVLHPVTCQPVEVCFVLPPGCPKVNVSRRSLEFDYGRREIELNFRRNGTVDVDYD